MGEEKIPQQRQQHEGRLVGGEIDLVGITDPDELEEALAKLKLEDLEELARVSPVESFGNAKVFEDFPITAGGGEDNYPTADDLEELEDIEPVNPWEEGERVEDFTEEELINALRSFEEDSGTDDNNINDDDLVDFPTDSDVLPELEFLETEGSQLLEPVEFTASIFDAPADSDEIVSVEDEDSIARDQRQEQQGDEDDSSETKPIELNGTNTTSATDDEKKADLDEDLELLEGLQKLNLDWQHTEGDNDIDDEYNDIPPYMYCQPCTPAGTNTSGFSLPSIAEDDTLDPSADLQQFEQEGRPRLPQKEFDALLQLSILSDPYFAGQDMDSLFETAASSEAHAVAANHHVPSSPNNQVTASPKRQKQEQHTTPEETTSAVNTSQRVEALDAAAPLLANFVANAGGLKNERSCLGHKETTFGLAFSECGQYLASASQDSSVRVWDVATNSALSTLQGHSKEHECLRVAWASSNWAKGALDRGRDSLYAFLVATAGADGTVMVWNSKDPSQKNSFSCCATLDHTTFDRVPSNPEDDKDKPQVYAIQWIDHWNGLPLAQTDATQNSFLLTSSDDFVHLWELDGIDGPGGEELKFREVMSLHFTSFHNYGYGVSICQVTDAGLKMDNNNPKGQASEAPQSTRPVQRPFGGDRNPNNMIFAFDALYCAANGLLGVALSDGSLRLINGRGVCISIVALPGCQSHLTSFSWDSTGNRLVTCVATGHVILWGIEVHEGMGSISTTCSAILEGGHEPGRPVFGSKFIGEGENILLSWGVDGRLCLWDSFSSGNIHAPIATLVSNESYPIYAVDAIKSCIAVGGGGGEESFLGIPVLLYDIKSGK